MCKRSDWERTEEGLPQFRLSIAKEGLHTNAERVVSMDEAVLVSVNETQDCLRLQGNCHPQP